MPTVPDSDDAYPIWWNTTITIYNKYIDGQTLVEHWYRTVIEKCFWQLVGTKVTIGDSVLDTKEIVCRIRKDTRFLDKDLWIQTPNDQKGNYFTLGQGDIIVKGESTFVINAYADGYRASDLLAKYRDYQQCMEIGEYSNNTGTGRGLEHYLARGK